MGTLYLSRELCRNGWCFPVTFDRETEIPQPCNGVRNNKQKRRRKHVSSERAKRDSWLRLYIRSFQAEDWGDMRGWEAKKAYARKKWSELEDELSLIHI